MQFITGTNRYQPYYGTVEEQVSPDNPARIIDAFIDNLDLSKLDKILIAQSAIAIDGTKCF